MNTGKIKLKEILKDPRGIKNQYVFHDIDDVCKYCKYNISYYDTDNSCLIYCDHEVCERYRNMKNKIIAWNMGFDRAISLLQEKKTKKTIFNRLITLIKSLL